MIRKALTAGVGLVLAVVVVAAARTLALPVSALADANPAPDVPQAIATGAAARLGEAIRIKTISFGGGRTSRAAFEDFHAFLKRAYPKSHAAMERTVIAGQSLIFRWPGRDPAGRPVALAAHMDVVPVEPGTEDDWEQPPFSGAIARGIVWGRGALDDKGSLIAIMEAAERLIAQGFAPARDVYFLFGHDEEIGGLAGAGGIVEVLRRKGVAFEWVLDEGSAPVRGVVPGHDGAAALISLGEKGFVTLELTVEAPGGHSSTPGRDTAASILGRAVGRIADKPFPAKIDRNIVAFLHAIAREQAFPARLVLANLWLTGGLVAAQLDKDPAAAAMLRTTTAVTVLQSGSKENILPQKARALVNFRIHPRDTPEDVIRRTTRIVDDPRVEIRPVGARPASEISSADGLGYRAVVEALSKSHGAIVVAPSLTLGGTDLRHYGGIADDAYRFFPFVIEPSDLGRIHGTGERIEIENLGRGVMFYEALLRAQ